MASFRSHSIVKNLIPFGCGNLLKSGSCCHEDCQTEVSGAASKSRTVPQVAYCGAFMARGGVI